MLKCKFIEITLQHGCSPVNLLHIFGTYFPKNTSGRLLLTIVNCKRFQWLSRLTHCLVTTEAVVQTCSV